MVNNLKKVISAVIALALSVSSVAFAAPQFTDVAETASYAQAVTTLADLGIIAGYEDGSFKPDEKITRAEVTTMVVAALNRSEDAKGSAGTTKFADVNTEATKWASGYVNIGTSEGFIAGYEDGTFKPAENVTYAQIVKMLVCCIGYEKYAQYLGGWPNGYLSVGQDKGVTAGVSAASGDAVTRAQVAQMIYNTLDIPIVKTNGFTINESTGVSVPTLDVMDGTNDNEYQTILTNKHNAYVVEGKVTATNKSDTAVKADEVKFDLEFTRNYDNYAYHCLKGGNLNKGTNSAPSFPNVTMKVGKTNAADYLLTYAQAIVKIDDNDDATIISFNPSGRNTIVEFNADLIDDDEYNAGPTTGTTDVFTGETTVQKTPYLYYYSTKDASKSTKYSLNQDFELYVNGVKVTLTKTNFEKYVVNNDTGKIQLVDTYSKGTSGTDGKYDKVFASYYATVSVDSVLASSKKVMFKDQTADAKASLTLDTDVNDDLAYTITMNGEAVELTALQKDDVLSVEYDVTATAPAFANSNFYNIYVSRDTAEGKYTGPYNDNETVKIGDKDYAMVKMNSSDTFKSLSSGLNLADEYTLHLDAFGRIFTYETLTSSDKLAIIDKYTKSSADDYYRATLYTTDGTGKSLEVDTTKVTKFNNSTDVDNAIAKYVYADNNGTAATAASHGSARKPIEGRVVKYKISSSTNRIISLTVADQGKVCSNESYKENSMSVGTIKINDSTKVIDATGYNDISNPSYSDLDMAAVSSFVDGSKYTAYAYGDKRTDNTYPMVLVTKNGSTYATDVALAVISKVPNKASAENGDDIYTVEVKQSGEDAKVLNINDDADLYNKTNVSVTGDSILSGLTKGDVIAYQTDAKGNVKRIDVIAKGADFGVGDYAKTYASFIGGTAPTFYIPYDGNKPLETWTTDWTYTRVSSSSSYSGDDTAQLVAGPIVDKNGNSFSLGKVAKNKSGEYYTNLGNDASKAGTTDGAYDISTDSNTRVYVWDYSITNDKQVLTAGSVGNIVASSVPTIYQENDGDIYNWSKMLAGTNGKAESVNFAFAKVVDGTATDVYVFLAK